ncbi:MAG: DUF4158 domain-containing protein [Burkholderiales bacterium]
MSSIEETAYPRLQEDVSLQELDQLYTPTPKERAFVNETYRRPMPRPCLMLLLKLMQRLGHTVPLAGVPLAITTHICRKLKVARPTKDALARYDGSGETSRHRQHVLKVLGLREPDAAAMRWLRSICFWCNK